MEAVANAETMEECWLISRALHGLLSYKIQEHLPRDGATHNGLGPHPCIKMFSARLCRGILLTEKYPSQMILA